MTPEERIQHLQKLKKLSGPKINTLPFLVLPISNQEIHEKFVGHVKLKAINTVH